jgi:ABC-type amino acid transport substrate-binding protein
LLIAKLRAAVIGLILAAAPAQAAPVLRVGVADGAQPCSYRQRGSWSGMAVELWQRIADEEQLPYVLVPGQSAAALLAATQRGELDVAIGCLTVSPERLRGNRFSLPFQEMGLGVMTLRSRLDLGVSLLQSLLSPDLIRLLLAYVGLIGVLSVAVWRVERAGSKPADWPVGRRRSFALIFQVLATGPGTNTVVVTSRGHSLVFLAYLVRIVSASLLVSFVTINVVRGNDNLSGGALRNLRDLAGQRVGVRQGSVSELLLQKLNQGGLQPTIQLRELKQVLDADELLSAGAVDAVMADEIQLDYLMVQLADPRYGLALRNLHPQSQAFAFSPTLNQATASKIDLAMGRLKRDGVVGQLRRQAIDGSAD